MRSLLTYFEHLPIRLKLTVWYTLSFMAVMAFSFISFYLVTRSLLLSEIDDSLKSESGEIVTLLKDQTISPASKDAVLRTFKITKSNFVLVLNSNNEIVAQSQTLPIDNALLTKLAEAIETHSEADFETIDINRFYIEPLYNHDSRIGTIIVGDSIVAINEAFSVLVNTLVLIFLLFLLPLVLVSFLEADISLSPLRSLAQKMNTITTKNLSNRVDILNVQDEIGEVSMAFNKLLDRLQRGFIKERQLIHDVSHQLKTPLTAMRSEIEIALAKHRKAADYEGTLKDLFADTKRMSNIVKDMLDFAWAASEDQDKTFEQHNVSHILEEVAEITQQLASSKRIKVNTSILPDLMVMGQREKLLQIFMNVVENAIKYSKERGSIFIQASNDNQYAKIIIKDNGIGISKKDISHIFERFYRGKSNVGDGSGLGLSIAAALVKAHKGTIDVVSEKGRGATFVISLPLIYPVQILKDERKNMIIPALPLKRPHIRTFIRTQLSHLETPKHK